MDMNPDELIAYLKSQKWFYGVRIDSALLFYSAKQEGMRKHVKNMHGIDFAETLRVPLDGKPVRVINTEQAKAFHGVSLTKIQKDPSILSLCIKENDELWARIAGECDDLDRVINVGDDQTAIQMFKKISSSYAEASAQFIVIFSLGLKLTELGDTGATKLILEQHDSWRNQIAFKEERMGEHWYRFFDLMRQKYDLKSSAKDLMGCLSLPEVLAWLDDRSVDVDNLVATRQKQDFVYHDSCKERYVVDDADLVSRIVSQLSSQTQDVSSSAEIKGQQAFVGDDFVTGEVLVIKTKNELNAKAPFMSGKIIVAEQTTPYYIQYLKNVKSIITDEGGITCHAAIVSREMCIPCIIGTKNATQILQDGDLVEVDVGRGIIKVIKSV
ncbi:MAG: PEP-utilizing enzyme [Patescibacteria group bacterium]